MERWLHRLAMAFSVIIACGSLCLNALFANVYFSANEHMVSRYARFHMGIGVHSGFARARLCALWFYRLDAGLSAWREDGCAIIGQASAKRRFSGRATEGAVNEAWGYREGGGSRRRRCRRCRSLPYMARARPPWPRSRQVAPADAPYGLYAMDVSYRYDLDRIIERGLGSRSGQHGRHPCRGIPARSRSYAGAAVRMQRFHACR